MKQNYIIENLNGVAQLTAGSKQGEFYATKAKNAKPVTVVPVSEVFGKEELERMMLLVTPEKKQCYRTAQKLAMSFEGIEYVEGEVGVKGTGISVPHAFNRKGDKYFDMTLEVALNANVSAEDYVSILELPSEKVADNVYELKRWTDLIPYEYENGWR